MTTKKTKRYLAAAALLGGGVTIGAVFSPIGLAGAQTSDDSTDDSTHDSTGEGAEETEGRRGRHHRAHERRAERVEAIASLLGLTVEELHAEAESGKTLAEIAEGQGVSRDELTAAILAEVETRLDAAVEEGRIDEDQAAERLAEAPDRIEEMVDVAPADRAAAHRRAHRRHNLRHGGGEVLDELGISGDELRAGFEDGKTMAEIAAEQGVSEEALVDALVAAATERVDEAVTNGRIDDEKAAEIKDQLDDRIAEMVDAEPGERRGHGRGHGHP